MTESESEEPIPPNPKTPKALLIIFRVFSLVTAFVGAAHLFLAQTHNDGKIFQRFGAFMIAAGLIAFALIRLWLTREQRRGRISQFEYDMSFQSFAAVGIIYSVVGTLIWGYGDLLPIF